MPHVSLLVRIAYSLSITEEVKLLASTLTEVLATIMHIWEEYIALLPCT